MYHKNGAATFSLMTFSNLIFFNRGDKGGRGWGQTGRGRGQTGGGWAGKGRGGRTGKGPGGGQGPSEGPGPNVIKLYTCVIKKRLYSAGMFFPLKPLKPCLLFASRARAYPSAPSQGLALGLAYKHKTKQIGLPETNTLVYSKNSQFTVIKVLQYWDSPML